MKMNILVPTSIRNKNYSIRFKVL